MHKHTQLWKREDAKNPSKHYGIMVANCWYWYEEWKTFVLKELNNLKSKNHD